MAEAPPFLTLKEHRDRAPRGELAARWTVVSLLALLAGLALLNVFGQEPAGSAASGGGATVHVSAPDALRGGLFYMGRFRITAEQDVRSATLVLDEGWLENMHINTIEPSPVGEASRDGRLALDFGHVPAGQTLVAYLQFQVNPTTVGRRSQGVALYDGERLLAEVDRTVTIWP